MKKIIGLISCVQRKHPFETTARELYSSPWFEKASLYIEQAADAWFILSAKHGLLSPDKIIEPYNLTLRKMTLASRREWAERVLRHLVPIIKPDDTIIILAGRLYREHLVEPLRNSGAQVVIPLQGLRIGEQLHWLNHRIEQAGRKNRSELDQLNNKLTAGNRRSSTNNLGNIPDMPESSGPNRLAIDICREEILASVEQIIYQKGENLFTIEEVLRYMNDHNTRYAENTIRVHISGRMCANAPQHHAVKYADFERVGRGSYRVIQSNLVVE